jgi:casein kinase II subunit beta
VTEDFIEDDFNLTGLNLLVPFWKEAMEMVLDVEPGVGFFSVKSIVFR